MNFSSPSFSEIEFTIGLALDAFQPGFDHREFRGIDHHRHAGDVGLGGDQVEEIHHRLCEIEQALVHVDVDDLRAVRDLSRATVERGGKSPAVISLRNRAEPVTLVRSPILTKRMSASA